MADPRDLPVPDGGMLLLTDPGGEVLATITPRPGSTPRDALDAMASLAPLLALLPPGAHPIPVN